MTTKMKKKTDSRFKKSSLVQAWLVLLLAVGFGVSMAGVQLTLGPKIEQNKKNETRERIPVLVLGKDLASKMAAQNQTLEIKPRQVEVKSAGKTKYYPLYETRYQGDLRGWVIKAKGQGYADTIELLLGLAPDLGTITGMFVLDQKETPGLGNKIITDVWREQFNQKPTTIPLKAVKKGAAAPGEIDAITGATISSQSVTNLINTVIRDVRQALSATSPMVDVKEKSNG